jgi:hypothetical protein
VCFLPLQVKAFLRRIALNSVAQMHRDAAIQAALDHVAASAEGYFRNCGHGANEPQQDELLLEQMCAQVMAMAIELMRQLELELEDLGATQQS